VVIGVAALGWALTRPAAPLGTPTAAASPTAAYPYAQRGPVAFAVDFVSQHGVCNNRYASGRVYDLDGQPVDGLSIVILAGSPPDSPEQSLGAVTGGDPDSEAGSWHTSLLRLGEPEAYTVELRGAAGELLAEPVSFGFEANCAENMAVIEFVQVAGQ
jgi:hypothetical protein